MNRKFSKQEGLFLLGRWSQLLEDAIDAESQSAVSKRSSDEAADKANRIGRAFYFCPVFSLPFKEWQALLTLLESKKPTDLPSRLYADACSDDAVNPLFALMVHVCCWFDGGINDAVFRERLSSMEKYVGELQLHSERHSVPNEGKDALRVTSFFVKVFIDLLSLKSSSEKESTIRTECAIERAIEDLIQWSGAKRSLVQLAHAITLGVMAWMFPRPRFAASAVEVLRKSQKRLNDLYAELVRSFETTDDAACTSCNITGWRVVLRLEEELVRRQRSQDIEDLFAVSDRWWEESDGGETDLSGDALHSGDVKMRWAAARKRYVGQDHVWDSLTRHFLNVSIFNVEKPTVIVLFGPSGYGKSEAARLIACALHGCKPSRAETDGYLVHIHLPSFCTKDSIYSLVDPPAAHVGEGLLLSALRRNNEAVVVLDEFEKGAAEAIQHLWLSAFQKHGTLRSLKDASRTVSTDRVTFVLTCNIAAEVIQRDEGRYLGASTEEERKAIRDEWVELCRAVCRDAMHEPFVNRVDYFLPFAPYTAKEKEKFVKLQLSRIMLDQQRRGIQLCVTPNLVKVLSSQLKTFHSSHVEGKLMPLLMKVHQRKWGRAVLTSEERVCGQLYVVVPVTERCDGEETWETLHRGLASLAVYEKPKNITLMPHSEAPRTTEGAIVDPVKHTPLEATEASLMSGVGKNSDGHSSFTDRSSFKARSKSLSVDVRRVSHSKKELDCLMSLETELERKLRVDLEKAEALLVEKDLEISYLKEKVLRLEKIVAVLLANVLCFAFLLSMIVGMKTVLIISIALLVSMTLLVGMPFKLLISSLSVLYGILGPYGSAAGVGVVSVWLISTARSAAYC